mmetsp:Transcript_5545/g.10152  ORF Transcript_5545/g.10152 Transcript_5545/m.10152 type:complete len:96 (+) Transcript_5545:64-351(+)
MLKNIDRMIGYVSYACAWCGHLIKGKQRLSRSCSVLHTDMPRLCNVMAGLFALQFGQLANKAFFCTRSDFLHPRHCNGFSPGGTSSFSLDIITAG